MSLMPEKPKPAVGSRWVGRTSGHTVVVKSVGFGFINAGPEGLLTQPYPTWKFVQMFEPAEDVEERKLRAGLDLVSAIDSLFSAMRQEEHARLVRQVAERTISRDTIALAIASVDASIRATHDGSLRVKFKEAAEELWKYRSATHG